MLSQLICLLSNLSASTVSTLSLLLLVMLQVPDWFLVTIGILGISASAFGIISILVEKNAKLLAIIAMSIYALLLLLLVMYSVLWTECKRKPDKDSVLKMNCSHFLSAHTGLSITKCLMHVMVGVVVFALSILSLMWRHFTMASPPVSYGPLQTFDENNLENTAIATLKKSLVDPRYASFTELDWLRLAWSRKLDSDAAIATADAQAEFTAKFKLESISMETIQKHITMSKLPVLSGSDLQGRPILWQRMKFLNPKEPVFVGLKASWLAFDAALSDETSIRNGICLVYDFTGAGLQNVSMELLDMTNGPFAASTAHPSHVARILFVNMPWVLGMAYGVIQSSLSKEMAESVEMIYTDTPDWYATICAKTELPEFLGGTPRGDYFEWMNTKLRYSHGIYGPMTMSSV